MRSTTKAKRRKPGSNVLIPLLIALSIGVGLGVSLSNLFSSEQRAAFASRKTPTGKFPLTPTPALSSSQDTTSPSVTITYPQDGSSFSGGLNILIRASAIDNSTGGISHVEFRANDELLCIDSVAPHECAWTIPPQDERQYTLEARAYDLAHNIASAFVRISTYPRTLNRGRGN